MAQIMYKLMPMAAQIEGTTTLNYFKKPIPVLALVSFEGFAIHFFFKKGTCIVLSQNLPSASGSTIPTYQEFLEDISSVIGATYDWQNVDNYFQVTTELLALLQHYFIDYKNWRYFRIKEFKTSVLVLLVDSMQ
jgi:hypothetical protein